MSRLSVLQVALGARDGGAEGQTAALAAGMATRGHKVLALVRRGTPIEGIALRAGAPIFPLQPSFPSGPGGIFTWWSRRKARTLSLRGGWEVVHFMDPGSFAGASPILSGAFADGDRPPPAFLVTWRGPRAGAGATAPAALRRHHRAGGWIHAASEGVWAALVREGFDEDRLTVIHPGIPMETPAADRAPRGQVRHELGFADDDELIGSVAVLDADRGLDELIDAMGSVVSGRPRAALVIAGDGPRRAALELRARRSAAAARIRFAGRRDDVRRLLAALDLYVFPGRGQEVFPLALVEAMAAAVPVVVCDQPGIREIIENGKQGLFVPGTGAESLARTILGALREPERSRAMGQAGAVRVQRFSTRAMVDATEKLYYRLVKAGTQR